MNKMQIVLCGLKYQRASEICSDNSKEELSQKSLDKAGKLQDYNAPLGVFTKEYAEYQFSNNMLHL